MRPAVTTIILVVLGAVLIGLGFNAVLSPSCQYQFVRTCPMLGDYLLALALGVPGALALAGGVISYRGAKTR